MENYLYLLILKLFVAQMDMDGVFDSMKNTYVLEDIKQKGIEWVFVTPVDNPLMELIDPIFVGFAKKEKYEMLGKSIVRTDPFQKNGDADQ